LMHFHPSAKSQSVCKLYAQTAYFAR